MPLFMSLELFKNPDSRPVIADVISKVIQRADEPAELLTMFLKEQGKGDKVAKKTIPNQLKKGINAALAKFNAYALAKYKGTDRMISLADVIKLTHPAPRIEYKKLIEGTLETPDTWEVEYSKPNLTNADKVKIWTRLISEKKLGALAFLRNIGKMIEVGVPDAVIKNGLKTMNVERVLPYRFITASKYAPRFESDLEACMFNCLKESDKLTGKTVLLVDVSGSMDWALSDKSQMNRIDAANGLAMLLREVCEDVAVFTFSDRTVEVPTRRGFALADAIKKSQPHSGTRLNSAIAAVNSAIADYDRIIVITDEQSSEAITAKPKKSGYIINVAAYENGVAYDKFVHINGWSEAVVDYITAYEKL
jgi:hypothetical protein